MDGLVWDRSATKVARSTSLADERALLRQIDAYVGGGGGEWAGSDTDSDDDFCSPSEGGSGDDYSTLTSKVAWILVSRQRSEASKTGPNPTAWLDMGSTVVAATSKGDPSM